MDHPVWETDILEKKYESRGISEMGHPRKAPFWEEDNLEKKNVWEKEHLKKKIVLGRVFWK